MSHDHDAPDALGLTPAEIGISAGVPWAKRYNDVYFSAEDGLAESEHVFIRGNDLMQRWARWSSGRPFVIVETGTGTGRNLLLAWRLFRAVAPAAARLHLVSIEKHPLSGPDLARVWADRPDWAAYADRLRSLWPAPIRGVHRRVLDSRVTLDFVFDDVLAGLARFDGRADAWFLDGFAPRRNPRMWRTEVFEAIAAASRPGATFATYSCAGAVRRGLVEAGFDCARRAGFGRKRDMLTGSRSQAPAVAVPRQRMQRPWFVPPAARPAARIAVIGAGIAGAATAEALARRGRDVRIFDPQGIAGGASGNRQAALYIRPAAEADRRTRFYLAALDYTFAWLTRIDPQRALWSDCGLLQLALSERETARQARCIDRLALPASRLQRLDAVAAAEHAGAVLSSSVRGALYYPRAGWVRPDALCRALIERAGALVRETAVTAIAGHADGWRVTSGDGSAEDFDQVVLACGAAVSDLSDDLPPLSPVRGQVSLFDLDERARQSAPRAVVCGRGYVAPPLHGRLAIGASFVVGAADSEPEAIEDQDNLAMLAEALPVLAARLGASPTASRVAWRCVGPDRLPCVGPVPDAAAWRCDYADLARDANRIAAVPGATRPGLWVSTAHGSQGLVSAPLAAEMLASRICNEPMPLAADLVDALHPGRGLIRELVRGT